MKLGPEDYDTVLPWRWAVVDESGEELAAFSSRAEAREEKSRLTLAGVRVERRGLERAAGSRPAWALEAWES